MGQKMADDNKRNALFSKLFSKEKKEQKNSDNSETADLDAIMAQVSDENNISDASADDDYTAWLKEAMNTDGGEQNEDYSDTIAELFGNEGVETAVEEDETLDIPMLEDYEASEDAEDEILASIKKLI